MRDEGLRLKTYTDTVGKLSVGVGRNLTDNGISEDEAFYLLNHDIDNAIRDCVAAFTWFPALDPVRQRIIINMMFNMGRTRLVKFVNTMRAVGEGRYEDAAVGMLQSLWASQVGSRALRLAEAMRIGRDTLSEAPATVT